MDQSSASRRTGSKAWYEKLWQNTVDFFRSLDIPVRCPRVLLGRPELTLEGQDHRDVKAWSPRPKKYFEGRLLLQPPGDAQARPSGHRITQQGEPGRRLRCTPVSLTDVHDAAYAGSRSSETHPACWTARLLSRSRFSRTWAA
ncbi:MAG: hypothetical protein ACLR4Z_17020 [Butyricicoccaceae bacterium]